MSEQPVRKVAYALAPGELAALAQQDGAPAGLTDDEAREWYQARPPQTIDLVMAGLAAAAETRQLREAFAWVLGWFGSNFNGDGHWACVSSILLARAYRNGGLPVPDGLPAEDQ